MHCDDERLYSQVANELSRAGPIPGLWAKAFAEANGVDGRAKAIYLRYRVAQLAEGERQAAEIELERRRSQRATEVEREYDALLGQRSPVEDKLTLILVGICVLAFIMVGLVEVFK